MELWSMLCGGLDGRGVWGRMDICICIAKSLCYSPEVITTFLTGYNPNFFFLLYSIVCPQFLKSPKKQQKNKTVSSYSSILQLYFDISFFSNLFHIFLHIWFSYCIFNFSKSKDHVFSFFVTYTPCLLFFFLFWKIFYVFIFWLCWVFVAVHRLSLVAGHQLLFAVSSPVTEHRL